MIKIVTSGLDRNKLDSFLTELEAEAEKLLTMVEEEVGKKPHFGLHVQYTVKITPTTTIIDSDGNSKVVYHNSVNLNEHNIKNSRKPKLLAKSMFKNISNTYQYWKKKIPLQTKKYYVGSNNPANYATWMENSYGPNYKEKLMEPPTKMEHFLWPGIAKKVKKLQEAQ